MNKQTIYWGLLAAGVVALLAGIGFGQSTIDYTTVDGMTNNYTDTTLWLSNSMVRPFYFDDTILFTNCVCMSSDGVTRLSMSNMLVTLRIGNLDYNESFSMTSYTNTTSWYGYASIPIECFSSGAVIYVQTTISSTNTGTYTYPRKTLLCTNGEQTGEPGMEDAHANSAPVYKLLTD